MGKPSPVIHTAVNHAVRQRYKVQALSGQQIELLSMAERDMYIAARDKYTSENIFTAASDLRTLDRLVLFEVQVFRWQWQMAAGQDYDSVSLEAAEEVSMRRAVKDTETMISQLQNDLGLTKVQRDKAGNAESVPDYLMNLKLRAKEHGIRRDKQVAKAVELINELFAIVGSYRRSNPHERAKLGFENAEEIVEWIAEVMRPQFDEVDKAYRVNQKMWLRTL